MREVSINDRNKLNLATTQVMELDLWEKLYKNLGEIIKLIKILTPQLLHRMKKVEANHWHSLMLEHSSQSNICMIKYINSINFQKHTHTYKQ
jgi:hypothetical protein